MDVSGPRTTAETAHGTVRGTALAGGAAQFAGIPFAAPPVGELRFRPPQPPRPWPGVRDGTVFRPAPPQRPSGAAPGSGSGRAPAAGRLAAATRIADTSEDCLYLNVWTPPAAAGSPPHPVIAWIYGGGFEGGSAALPATDGAALSRQTGAVVVAANYRVGALGFLYAGAAGRRWAAAANLGLQDQAAALRWIRENIAAFGGDPGNVTVAGESAGAFSIGALLAAPAASGTFGKAILHSGSASRIRDPETATAIAGDFLAALGLRDPDGLGTIPVERLLDAQSAVTDRDIGRRNLPGGRSWGIVLDGTVLPRDPLEAVAAGAAAGIPLLIGANRDETRIYQAVAGDAFRPPDERALQAEMSLAGIAEPEKLLNGYRRRHPGAALADLRSAFLTDAIYRLPATRLAAAQAGAGGAAYSYLFAAQPLGPALGAFHGADLLYTFDKLSLAGAQTAGHRGVRDALAGAWAAFAASGDPGWPRYDAGAPGNARAFGGQDRMVTEPPDDEVTACWTSS